MPQKVLIFNREEVRELIKETLSEEGLTVTRAVFEIAPVTQQDMLSGLPSDPEPRFRATVFYTEEGD